MTKFTQKQKEEIAYEYESTTITGDKLAKKHNCSRKLICNIVNEFNISRIKNKNSGTEIILDSTVVLKIIELYHLDFSIVEISKRLSISQYLIRKSLKQNNLIVKKRININRKWSINENYLDKIDTPDKAVFLGFFFADGYNQGYNISVIALAEEDKSYLEKLNRLLHPDKPIYYSGTNKKFHATRQGVWKININSKQICSQLNKYGAVNKKSLILKWPNELPNHLEKYFIRGYFDGDGCITFSKFLSKRKQKKAITIHEITKYHLSIAGTLSFLTSIQSIIKKLNIKSSIYFSKSNSIYYLAISSRSSIKLFLDYIYDGISVSLDRKYQKYQQFLKDYENRVSRKIGEQILEKTK